VTDVFLKVPRRSIAAPLLFGAAALAAAPAAGQALPPPGSRILVLPFATDVGAEAPEGAALWLGEAAALLLTDELARLGFGALPREERVLAFERLGLPMSAVLTRATMIRVGELIGASEVIFGEVSLDDELTVTARTVHLAPGRQLPDASDRASLSEIFGLFRRVADRIAGGALPSAPGEATDQPDLSLEMFENYVKGLVASTPATQRRFLELAMAGAPHDPRVLVALWEVYTAEGEHELALAVASAVRDDAPGAARARYFVALSLIELRRLDGAFQTLDGLDDGVPAAAVANALGVVQLRRDPPEPASAASYFARAAEGAPGNTDYLFNRGYAHARAGDAPSALYWLRETVRFDAANGDAHLVMAIVLAGEGRSAEAGREWELARLLGAVPASTTAVPADVPDGMERLDPPTGATGAASAAAAGDDPAQRDQQAAAAFHLTQGRRLLEAGRDREAMTALRRAIYLSPYDDEPHLLLGRLYHRAGRLQEAIDELKVAIWSDETVEARLALGEALLEHGDEAAARSEARRALALSPGSTEAQDLLVRAGGGVVPSTTTPWRSRPTGRFS